MKRLRPLLKLLLNLVGPAILIYFLATTDLAKLWRVLIQTDLGLLALSCLLVAPFLVLKGWRWLLILRAGNMPLPLMEATALYCIGIFLGVVTPGQAGDAVKAWYLRKRGYPLSAGLASVVVDRLYDLGIMGILAALGFYAFANVLPGGALLNALVLVAVLCGVLAGLALAGSRRFRRLIFGRILPSVMPAGLRDRLSSTSGLHLTPRQLFLVGVISAAGLGLTFVRVYLLFLAIGTPVPFIPFVALTAIVAIVSTFSPGGVGTRDLALTLGLAAILGQSPDEAAPVALSVSALLLLLNVVNVIIGFACSLRYPINEVLQPKQA